MRPGFLFPLFAPVTTLKGVGPARGAVAGAAGRAARARSAVPRPQALIAAARHRRQATEGEVQTFNLRSPRHFARPAQRALQIRALRRQRFPAPVYVQGPWPPSGALHPAAPAASSAARSSVTARDAQIAHPAYVPPASAPPRSRTEAVYPATAGLPSRTVRRFALRPSTAPPTSRNGRTPPGSARQNWPSWREALQTLHAPTGEGDLSPQSPARRRLAFDELLAHQLALAQRKGARRADLPPPSRPPPWPTPRSRPALRPDRRPVRSLAEIRDDLASGERMARLIQGDVGSGKTVVAMLAMADVAAAGLQSVLMAPTEILARQHFETLAAPLAARGVQAILLTGRDKGAARAEKLAALADGCGRRRRRHPRPVPGRRRLPRPGPGRHRRAAPFRRLRARPPPGQGRAPSICWPCRPRPSRARWS